MNAHFARLRRGAQLGKLLSSVSAQDRARVIRDFAATYARVGASLLASPQSALRELAESVSCLFRMLIDRSFRVSWGTTAAIVFALGYFVCPFDLIPDSIPFVGFLDDAALVAEITVLISGDIRRFRARSAAAPSRPAPAAAASPPRPASPASCVAAPSPSCRAGVSRRAAAAALA